ncbi:hypothetical protein [Neoroseomonas marina]|uniref:hypothetical protein n=1 Tax=Neoroseomonas marina TaxID=1232220 RepID=UPI001B7D6998|nr:hypothetical protein [Neoroseomonas marina]
MKRILTETAAVANATLRALFTATRDPEWAYYPGLGLAESALHQRLGVRDADPRDHPRGGARAPTHRLPR